jgi:molybdopterin-guanine dinucleotide biosynthesis protein A
MTSPFSCTGVILTGGLNLRFGGKNKALSDVGGKTILDRTLTSFANLFRETMLVTKTPLEYLAWDALIVTDIFSARSPLAGLHAGLTYTRTQHIFITACDTPFIKTPLIKTVLDKIDTNSDVIVPETEKGLQPLFAVYTKTCLPIIEKLLRLDATAPRSDAESGNKRVLDQGLKILNIFDHVRVKKIPEPKLLRVDPDLLSFFNVNTPEDFARAEQILSENPDL